ncbi:MAG: hypothetical protein HKN50_05685 [Gammaproteobacteria bacterium]|nr:hypothetical protein [Gammaproteobacteria bacterium]
MKKLLIGVAILVAIIAITATIFVGQMDQLIADAIETEGSAALGSEVRVAKVETKLREGIATINGLTIANPGGYKAPHAISVANFTADVDYENQIVEQILIDQPVINAEMKGQQNNFEDLLANMPDSEESSEPEGVEPVITIKSFQLRRAQVNLTADRIGERSFIMDDLVVNDLRGTPEQISEVLTRRLIDHVSVQVKNYATAEITKMITEEARKRVKEAVNEKIQEQVGDKLKDKLGVADKLKGFGLGKD